jgi:hypothetical protein
MQALLLFLILAAASAASHATTAGADVDVDADEAAASPPAPPKAYTWQDLQDRVPELQDMELKLPRRRAADGYQQSIKVAMVCEDYAKIGTRIKRQRCFPLEDFLRKRANERQLGYMWFDLLAIVK